MPLPRFPDEERGENQRVRKETVMKKLLLALVPVLLIGTAFASFASYTARPEAMGPTVVEEASISTPNAEDFLLDGATSPDPFQGGGVQGLNLCRIQCRIDLNDCLEFCSGTCSDCYASYQACLANC